MNKYYLSHVIKCQMHDILLKLLGQFFLYMASSYLKSWANCIFSKCQNLGVKSVKISNYYFENRIRINQ